MPYISWTCEVTSIPCPASSEHVKWLPPMPYISCICEVNLIPCPTSVECVKWLPSHALHKLNMWSDFHPMPYISWTCEVTSIPCPTSVEHVKWHPSHALHRLNMWCDFHHMPYRWPHEVTGICVYRSTCNVSPLLTVSGWPNSDQCSTVWKTPIRLARWVFVQQKTDIQFSHFASTNLKNKYQKHNNCFLPMTDWLF